MPVHAEPAGIEVDDITRYLVLTQFPGYIAAFCFAEVGDAAHPGAEAPQGGHFGPSYQCGVFAQHLLRRTQEDEDVHRFVCHKEFGGSDVGAAEVAGHGGGSVHKHAIAAVTEKEGDRLVHVRGFGALRVGDKEVDLLPGLVQCGGGLAATVDFLVWREAEYGIDAA